jgi:methyl-accepting chemotaxis protein
VRGVPRKTMKRNLHFHFRRRTKLVSPKFQGGAAILIIAVVLAAGALVGLLLFRDMRQALGNASASGHFGVPTSFRIVSDILVRQLLALFVFVFAGGSLAFLWYVRRIRLGISRLTEAFEAAEKGDLSSPSNVRGFKELVNFGVEIDEVRSYTLALIEEVRGEAEAIRTSDLSQVEFEKRWEALKEKIGRIVP